MKTLFTSLFIDLTEETQQPSIIPERTLVKHSGDDWVAVHEDPLKRGYVWLNIGTLGGIPKKHRPVLIEYGDAIYDEPRQFFPKPIHIPNLPGLNFIEPERRNRDTSEVINVPSELHNPAKAWEYVEANDYKRQRDLEYYIYSNPRYAYLYAYKVMKPLSLPISKKAEEVIAKNNEWAYWYAVNIIGKPWPEAENVILSGPYRDQYLAFKAKFNM